MSDVQDVARKAADSDAMTWGARLGLSARAAIYLLMGVLAVAVALGRSSSDTDQRGALTELVQHSGGKVLLMLLALGFAGYALWRYSEVALGVAGDGNGAGPRLKSLVRALIYTSLAVTAVTVLTSSGSGTSQSAQQEGLTARVMGHSGGRWLVGAVGLAILAAGATMVYEGATQKFEKYLRTGEMSASVHRTVRRLGTVGTIARGIVVGLSGALVVQAAVSFRPDKARGLDGALRTLAAQPYGTWLLVLAGLGLATFGVYGFAEARWRRT